MPFTKARRDSELARVCKALAEVQEEEEKPQLAIDAWRKAADCYESEGSMANALQCPLKVADLHVAEHQYKKAAKIFERCAWVAMDKEINKGSPHEYLYSALLCQFVVSARKGDLENLKTMFAQFLGDESSFNGTWQHKLLVRCMVAFGANDAQGFWQAADQNNIHPLDDRTSKILLEV